MLLAEWTVSPIGWPHRLARNPWMIYGIATVAYLISASPWPGPRISFRPRWPSSSCAPRWGPSSPARCWRRWCWTVRGPAPDPRQPGDGHPRPVVLRFVHLAPGRAGDGVPDDRHVHVQRRPGGHFRADHGAGVRHGGGQLRADRVPVPQRVPALGVPAGAAQGRAPNRCRCPTDSSVNDSPEPVVAR